MKKVIKIICFSMIFITIGCYAVLGFSRSFDDYIRHSMPYCSEDHYVFEDETCSQCGAEVSENGVCLLTYKDLKRKEDNNNEF